MPHAGHSLIDSRGRKYLTLEERSRFLAVAQSPTGDPSDEALPGVKATETELDLGTKRNLSTTLRHRRLRFTEQSVLLWMWQVG